MRVKDKFCSIVNKKFDLTIDHTKIVRTYSGRGQRNAGALSWFVLGQHPDIGSQWSITKLLKAKDIDFDGEHFFPIN